MLPPSWLTALCGPAAPIPTFTCCSSAPPRWPTRSSLRSPPADRARRRRRRPAAGASAWPTPPRAGQPSGHRPCARRSPRWPTATRRRASSRPAPAARSSPPPCSGFGRSPGVRRPALAAILPGVAGPVVLLDVGRLAGGPARPRWSGTPRSAPRTPALVARRRRSPGSGCCRSAPSRARATGARRAAEPLLAAPTLPAGARYVGLVEGHDVVARAGAPTWSSPTGSPATCCSRASRARTRWPAAAGPAPRAAGGPARRPRHRRRLPRRRHRRRRRLRHRAWPPRCTAAARPRHAALAALLSDQTAEAPHE